MISAAIISVTVVFFSVYAHIFRKIGVAGMGITDFRNTTFAREDSPVIAIPGLLCWTSDSCP